MLGEERLLVLYIRWDSVSNKGGAEYLYLESDSGRGDRSPLPTAAGFRGSERHCSEEGPCRGWHAGCISDGIQRMMEGALVRGGGYCKLPTAYIYLDVCKQMKDQICISRE